MTLREILSLSTEDLTKIPVAELNSYLAPLIPEVRRPDKDEVQLRDAKHLSELAARVLAQAQNVKPTN